MALHDDDLLLVNDSQDGNEAKKIKYSTLKSNIATDVGASDLQAVTDVGNTTDNVIEAGDGVKVTGGTPNVVVDGIMSPNNTGVALIEDSEIRFYANEGRARINANLQLGDANGPANVGLISTLTLSGNNQDGYRSQLKYTGNGTSEADATVNAIGIRDRLNIDSGHLKSYKAFASEASNSFDEDTTQVKDYYGFFVDGNTEKIAKVNSFAFYSGAKIPSYSTGSMYIGGTTSRNTRQLWESTLTEEQQEQLAAGTLAIPANVSTPGDGSFVRQWWYDQQSAEDQALIDAGELDYPEHLKAANFTDTFDLGDNTRINLLNNGLGEFKGGVKITGGTAGTVSPGISAGNNNSGRFLTLTPSTGTSGASTVKLELNNPERGSQGGGAKFEQTKTQSGGQETVLTVAGTWDGTFGAPGDPIAPSTIASRSNIEDTDSLIVGVTSIATGDSDSKFYAFSARQPTANCDEYVGYYSNIAASNGTTAFTFLANGDAPNFFNGNTYIGGNTTDLNDNTNIKLLSNGNASFKGTVDAAAFTVNGTPFGSNASQFTFDGATGNILSSSGPFLSNLEVVRTRKGEYTVSFDNVGNSDYVVLTGYIPDANSMNALRIANDALPSNTGFGLESGAWQAGSANTSEDVAVGHVLVIPAESVDSTFYLDPSTDLRYYLNTGFTYNGISYADAVVTEELLTTTLGFTKVSPTAKPKPDNRFYTVTGPNNDGSWNIVERDVDVVKAKLIKEQKQYAHGILRQTDWYVVRLAELGVSTGAIPPVVTTYRAAIRADSNTRCAEISAATDIPALIDIMDSGLTAWTAPLPEEYNIMEN